MDQFKIIKAIAIGCVLICPEGYIKYRRDEIYI